MLTLWGIEPLVTVTDPRINARVLQRLHVDINVTECVCTVDHHTFDTGIVTQAGETLDWQNECRDGRNVREACHSNLLAAMLLQSVQDCIVNLSVISERNRHFHINDFDPILGSHVGQCVLHHAIRRVQDKNAIGGLPKDPARG